MSNNTNNNNNNQQPSSNMNQNQQNDYRMSSTDLKILSDQTNPTQNIDNSLWLEQICGAQSIINPDHAKACQKFREYLKHEQRMNEIKSSFPSFPKSFSDFHQQYHANHPSSSQNNNQNNTNNQNNNNSGQQADQQNNNQQQWSYVHYKSNPSIGYYLVCGAAFIIGLKALKKIFFGKCCKPYHCQNYMNNGQNQRFWNFHNQHHQKPQ